MTIKAHASSQTFGRVEKKIKREKVSHIK